MSLNSCRGGCGEVYVDEWVNEPPCADNCGYSNCGRQPMRDVLRAMWGTPFCATGCGGCDSCGESYDAGGYDNGYVSDGGSFAAPTKSCNCGGGHSAPMDNSFNMPNSYSGSAPMQLAPLNQPSAPAPIPSLGPEPVPTPAPLNEPMQDAGASNRLSPARQRTAVRQTAARKVSTSQPATARPSSQSPKTTRTAVAPSIRQPSSNQPSSNSSSRQASRPPSYR